MSSISVLPYNESLRATWDAFVKEARNATFLFLRDFMDYHRDRFKDASLLLVDENGSPRALFPASAHDSQQEIRSHGGLTYGGILPGREVRTVEMGVILQAIIDHYKTLGFKCLVIRSIPHIYHKKPCEEELYWLFRHGAALTARAVSTAISLKESVHFSASRRNNCNKLGRTGYEIRENQDPGDFWSMLENTLSTHHGVRPVHSLEEIRRLSSAFPREIQLRTVVSPEGELLCGALLFLSDRVAHTQYLCVGESGRKKKALDFLLVRLIEDIRSNGISGFYPSFFDFGISTENDGYVLNEGLIGQKEGFGGFAINYDTYKLVL